MKTPVRFQGKQFKIKGLIQASTILNKHMTGGLRGIGKRLMASSRKYMRRDTGESQKSLKMDITGTDLTLSLDVWSNLTQAIIDAYGLKRGVFPPFRKGSRLYSWAKRKIGGAESATRVKEAGPVSPNPKRRAGGRKLTGSARRVLKRAENRATKKRKLDPVERIAWAIARKLFIHGIKPTHWNERALKDNRNYIISDLRNAIVRAAKEMSRG